MARPIFGVAVNFAAVRVYARGYTPFQPRRVAVCPNGFIYFTRHAFKADFSTNLHDRAWMIHELVHVWQHQTGVNVLLRGIFERRYRYALDRERSLAAYGIEQQASIVEDYFRMLSGLAPHRGDGAMADYRAVIPFLPQG